MSTQYFFTNFTYFVSTVMLQTKRIIILPLLSSFKETAHVNHEIYKFKIVGAGFRLVVRE